MVRIMNNNLPVMLITQARVKQDKNTEFAQEIKKITAAVSKYPGYVSQEIHQPNQALQQLDWIIIEYFVNESQAKDWLQSDERHSIFKDLLPLLLGLDHVYIMKPGIQETNVITATISNIIKPQDEKKFLDWQLRVAPIQSQFPGFIGYRVEKPRTGTNEAWITIVTFDTEEHLQAWLDSPERQKMLQELHSFCSDEHVEKVYSGFNFWFSDTSESRLWKENMLVVLTLYPVVFLLSYLQNSSLNYYIPFWLSLFFNNVASTLILSYYTVPFLHKKFNWWLHPTKENQKSYTFIGAIIVLLLYCLLLCACWLLTHFLGKA